MSVMSTFLPAPTGVTARFFGGPGGATNYYYFIQAIYPSGRSGLGISNLVTALAAFDNNNRMQVEWSAMAGAIGYNVFRAAVSTPVTTGTIFLATVTYPAYTDNGTPPLSAGQVILDGVRLWRARYDFAVDGDPLAPGLITLAQSDVIPKGAILVAGTANPTTAILGAGGSVAIGTSAGSAANSLKAAAVVAGYSINALLNLVPVFATPVKMTADGTITITSSGGALTAGVMDIMVMGYMPLS